MEMILAYIMTVNTIANIIMTKNCEISNFSYLDYYGLIMSIKIN